MEKQEETDSRLTLKILAVEVVCPEDQFIYIVFNAKSENVGLRKRLKIVNNVTNTDAKNSSSYKNISTSKKKF